MDIYSNKLMHYRTFIRCSFVAGLMGLALPSHAQPLQPKITAADVQTHLRFLASDELQGRRGGSAFEKQAADYLVAEFSRYGLAPAGTDGYLQGFPITLGVRLAPGNHLRSGNRSWTAADSVLLPWANSRSGDFKGAFTFAGYGLSIPEMKYDDYADLEVKGKVVLILRYGPDGSQNPHSEFGPYWPLRDKIKRAAEKGAVAVLLSLAPGETGQDTLLPLDRERMMAESDIPVLQIHADLAVELMQNAGQDLNALVKTIADSRKPASVATSLEVSGTVALEADKRTSHNVAAKVKGTDPKAGTIVIGAHYDHLGMGESGSLFRGPVAQIHNGADDNASGTAGLLELAAYFAQNPARHDLLFLGFGSEEMGLLGSDYYVNNPTVDLKSMRAMINMDMIGRMVDRKLLIFGTGSSTDWDGLLNAANTDKLELKLVPDGTGASDHTSFYNKQIPVLHYFTDTHPDYHKPSDDADLINYDGQVRVLEHVQRVVKAIDGLPAAQLAYTKAPVTQTRQMTVARVSLGLLPDYSHTGPGMKITGATDGRPGAKAGLVAGDIIVKIGEIAVKDIYDYMESLNKLQPGMSTTITVKRGEQELTLPIQL